MDEALRRIRRQYLSTLGSEDAANYIAALERAMGWAPPLHKYEIQNTLIVSSLHIPYEESEFLTQMADHSEVWASYEYGWIIWIPGIGSAEDQPTFFQNVVSGYPPNIANLMRLASNLDCEFLKIDNDGPVYSDLPTWDWYSHWLREKNCKN